MGNKKYSISIFILEIFMILLALIVIFPIVFVLMNSVKTLQQVSISVLSLPVEIHWENFGQALKRMNFITTFSNSIIVSVLSVAGLVLVSSMAAYQVVRDKCLAGNIIFYGIVFSMAIPFQALMVPLVIIAKDLNLTDSIFGLVIMYWGLLLPIAMFLYHGFIKGVPRELEEASRIDGCGKIKSFFYIVFPMLKPITTTIVIINILNVFNDFTLPLIMLSSNKTRTIPLAFSVFFGAYMNQWHLILAALTIIIIPTLIFFLFMQRHIMSGLTEGAIKG